MKIWILTVDSNFEVCKKADLFGFDVGSCDAQSIKETAQQKSSFLSPFDNSQLAIWKTVGKRTSRELLEVLKKDPDIVEKIYGNERVADLGLSEGEILVIEILDQGIHDHPVDNESSRAEELKEYTHYKNTLAALGKPPSKGAKSSEYFKSQGNASLAIHDGRRGQDQVLSTIAPPIQIFHPIFNDFTEFVKHPCAQPTVEDLDNVYQLMKTLSNIHWKEDTYREKVREGISRILGTPILEVSNPDNTRPDSIIMGELGDISFPCAFFELKREAGEGGCDPTSQASLSMKRGWINKLIQPIREKSCCPTFLIAAGGPWLNVMGGVFTDKIIVQHLTGFRWMAISSTEEDIQIYDNAKVFVALRECLKRLEEFHKTVDPPPFYPNKPHPRYFPYPISFSEDGTMFHFRYLSSLEDHPASVTYLAEITTQPGEKVVVKFVTGYGREVHEFLARNGWAPKLRYCRPLRETGLSNNSTRPTESPPPGLRLNVMHMVVMDYVDQGKPPQDARRQVETVLTQLHNQGYVFGDLREPNILFDTGGRVKFVDFDWCGRYDPSQAGGQIKSTNHVQAGDGTYAYYPLTISRMESMWAADIKPLTQIQPKHDWDMVKLLPW